MPSKGASRTTNHSTTATIAPVAGPAVVVRPSSTQAILAEPAPIQAVVGAPFAAGAAFVPDIEDPAVDTPEWADQVMATVAAEVRRRRAGFPVAGDGSELPAAERDWRAVDRRGADGGRDERGARDQ